MAKVKVTTKFKILELINGFVDNATANAIGNTVVEESKRLISEGQSPVRGEGRYGAYKNRKRYPGKRKPARPVNLNLSGEMLEGFGFRNKGSDVIEVGMVGGSARDKEIAGYHQTGTDNMIARPIVPQENEEWAITIMRAIRDEFGKRLYSLIKQSNKKD
jgi:hypothetical protein